MPRPLFARVSAALTLLGACLHSPCVQAARGLSPLYLADNQTEAIPGSYIVVLDPRYSKEYAKVRIQSFAFKRVQRRQASGSSPSAQDPFSNNVSIDEQINVGAVTMTLTEEGLTPIRMDETVLYVQQDLVVRTAGTVTRRGESRPYSWALDRIDQRDLPLDHQPYSEGERVDSSGVDVYVVDTGVYIDHVQLAGRASYYYVDPQLKGHDTNEAMDENGHGTHCAGIVAGETTGVTNAQVKAVKVFGPSGAGSLRAVYYGMASILNRPDKTRPAVASLSLGLPTKIELLNDMVDRLVADKVTVVVAAGNDGKDACQTSPGSAKGAITVASQYICTSGSCGSGTEMMPQSSNYGKCCDILAPGMNIRSSYIGAPTVYAEAGGTSQAAPFVAGAAVLYLSRYPDATPEEVKYAIVTNSAKGKLNARNLRPATPNRIVQVQFSNRFTLPNPVLVQQPDSAQSDSVTDNAHYAVVIEYPRASSTRVRANPQATNVAAVPAGRRPSFTNLSPSPVQGAAVVEYPKQAVVGVPPSNVPRRGSRRPTSTQTPNSTGAFRLLVQPVQEASEGTWSYVVDQSADGNSVVGNLQQITNAANDQAQAVASQSDYMVVVPPLNGDA